ncbi:MAG: RecX family transcriptional regulator [Chloroflexi bacterium]|nr:RecX family transcriptional regulator [Chloroflexota bacterium]MCL5107842.1 RecX family transcriptional regulator [Chloroflexota bacterium]
MPRVSALETQQRHAERVNVFLDGEFAFGLAVITAQQAGLHIGSELSQAEIEALLAEDLFQKALGRALVLLGYRPRSENEVRRRLARVKFEPAVADRVVLKLRADGLLDDREFARYWAENRTSFNPRGARLISQELRLKGVEREAIDEVLEENVDDDSAALAAGRKKAKQLAGLEYRDFRQKLGNFLARRGFNYDTAKEVVAKLWQENQGELPDEEVQ